MSYNFRGQMNDEDVLMLAKQHPFVLFRPLLKAVAILLIPFLVSIFWPLNSIISDLVIICVLFDIYYIYRAWFTWNNTMLLLTNKRVLVLNQKSLIHREMDGAGLIHIHQITHQVDGLLPSFFRYGKLNILTNDSQTVISIPAVYQPYDLQQKILETAFQAESGTL